MNLCSPTGVMCHPAHGAPECHGVAVTVTDSETVTVTASTLKARASGESTSCKHSSSCSGECCVCCVEPRSTGRDRRCHGGLGLRDPAVGWSPWQCPSHAITESLIKTVQYCSALIGITLYFLSHNTAFPFTSALYITEFIRRVKSFRARVRIRVRIRVSRGRLTM